MSNVDKVGCLVVVIIAIFTIMLVGISMGEYKAEIKFRKQAIEQGFAEYNNKTGLWQWKTNIVLNFHKTVIMT